MPQRNSSDVSDNWVKGMAGAGDKIKKGVQATDKNPMALAAAKSDKYKRGVADAVDSGKWQRGLARVSMSDWQQAVISKGVNRINDGARAAKGKFQQFMDQFLPHVAAGQAKIRSMPDNSLDDRLARMVEMARHNANFKRT